MASKLLPLTTLLPSSPSSENAQRAFIRCPSTLITSARFLFTGTAAASSLSCPSKGGSLDVARAVKEGQQVAPEDLAGTGSPRSAPSASNKLVLVIGGSGGVGQLIVASLLTRKIKTRLLLRDTSKAESLFGIRKDNALEVHKGDTRNPKDLDPTIFEGVTHVICCTGTTAFPSKRWEGDNTPERIDWEGIRNLVTALPLTIKKFVLVSSVGVTKFNELPWSIMNLFGVLKFKKMGEDFVQNSGLPFTIIRWLYHEVSGLGD